MANRYDVSKPDADLQTKLGVVVRTYRKRLGITQEELAWRANLHRTYIADIERGARNVTLRSLVNLTKALQVTVGNLLSYVVAPMGTVMRVGIEPDKPREILLVENNARDANMVVRAFRRARVTNPLKVARDAERGLDYLFGRSRDAKRKPAQPQLILLDLSLPRMSGMEFLRRIKGDERTHDIPVVILTTSRSDRMIIECGRLGAENYIIKPLGIESLVRVTPKLNLHLTLEAPLYDRTKPG